MSCPEAYPLYLIDYATSFGSIGLRLHTIIVKGDGTYYKEREWLHRIPNIY
jgi:hypothetical protein